MNARQALKESMDSPTMIAKAYLEDLSDADLLVRPVEGANHIAWQLGHLINSEHSMIELICPGSMPPLPEGCIITRRFRMRQAAQRHDETDGGDQIGQAGQVLAHRLAPFTPSASF